jgi:16S rRNA (uracil1498-N3)-methyltransferase
VAACEQCGGNRVPTVHAVKDWPAWLSAAKAPLRCVLSLAEGSRPLQQVLDMHAGQEVLFLSGPEGGLSPSEDAQARDAGFVPVSLGPRVLRAETAALSALVQALSGARAINPG